jgi:hypothetical protein
VRPRPSENDREVESRVGGREDKCEDERGNVVRERTQGVAPLHDSPSTPPAREAAAIATARLERRQAFENLFTLYESQHLQMMKIKDLLRK